MTQDSRVIVCVKKKSRMKPLEFCQSFRCHGLSSLQRKVCPEKKPHIQINRKLPKKHIFSLFSMLESFLNTQSPGTQKDTIKKIN